MAIRNPVHSPLEVGNGSLPLEFYTSQVVWDFWTISTFNTMIQESKQDRIFSSQETRSKQQRCQFCWGIIDHIWIRKMYPARKLTWLAGKSSMNESMYFPLEKRGMIFHLVILVFRCFSNNFIPWKKKQHDTSNPYLPSSLPVAVDIYKVLLASNISATFFCVARYTSCLLVCG